jgi:hypothetical protein
MSVSGQNFADNNRRSIVEEAQRLFAEQKAWDSLPSEERDSLFDRQLASLTHIDPPHRLKLFTALAALNMSKWYWSNTQEKLRAARYLIEALKIEKEAYCEISLALINIELLCGGLPHSNEEKEKFFKLYQSAADENPLMLLNLGRLHYKGFGTPVNFERARRCFTEGPFNMSDELGRHLTAVQRGKPGLGVQFLGGVAGAITLGSYAAYHLSKKLVTAHTPLAAARDLGKGFPVGGHIVGFLFGLAWGVVTGIVGAFVGAVLGVLAGIAIGSKRGLRSWDDLWHPISNHDNQAPLGDYSLLRRVVLKQARAASISSPTATGTAAACAGLRISPAALAASVTPMASSATASRSAVSAARSSVHSSAAEPAAPAATPAARTP